VCGFFCRFPLADWEQKLFGELLLRCLISELSDERSYTVQFQTFCKQFLNVCWIKF
jgi:hypothetical protein